MGIALSKILEEKGRQVHVTSAGQTVLEAVKKMNEKRVGALLVVEGGKPVGMFTERDLLTRVIDCECNPVTTKVGEVMTTELVVVCSSTTLEQAMAIVTEKRCRHLPVMDDDELVGLVSIGDLIRWVVKSQSFEIESLVRYIKGQYPG